jgi:glutathione S-transferase
MKIVDLETAKKAAGLRLVLVGKVPSPWSEGAKGLFHVKKLEYLAVRLQLRDPEFEAWTKAHNAPVALLDNEWPRSGWAEILALAERMGGEVSLIPAAADDRVRMFGLLHEVLGEQGLLWCARAILIEESLSSEGARGFPVRVAAYLSRKYAGKPGSRPVSRARVDEVLRRLTTQLEEGRARGGPYFFGEQLSALDLYSAAAMNVLAPLAPALCPMMPELQRAYDWLGAEVSASVTPALVAHRELVYERHLELPIEV